MRVIFLSFFLLCAFFIQAQNDSSRFEINAGINYFPPAVQNTNRFYDADYGYLIGIKRARWNSDKTWLRAGFNFNCTRLLKFPYDNSKVSAAINFGIEYRLFPGRGKKFSIALAGDIVPHYTVNVSRWNLHIQKVKGYGILIGPVIGFAYSITPKFSLGTEINYDIGYFYKISELGFTTVRSNGVDFYSHRLLGLHLSYKL